LRGPDSLTDAGAPPPGDRRKRVGSVVRVLFAVA
jgi:hypothetical protein